jgi:inner membrane protein
VSPLVHAELSWLLAQGLRTRRDRILVTCAGLAPDLDGLPLLAGVEAYARYHHVLFHGYVVWPTSMEAWTWHGQWDLASWQNGVIGLAATLACLACALSVHRTVVEVVSVRWDAEVVRTLRRRFLGEKPSAR